jgi:Holliday junction resolvasome RuvABC DNA-binding subunit
LPATSFNLRRKWDPSRRRNWDPATDELLRRGLVGMGFRAAEVKNALRTLAERHANGAPLSKEALFVEALRILT